MSTWQETLKQSITTVDELIDRFGAETIDRAAVERAIDRFNLRITPAALAQIRRPGDWAWNQYVPTAAENEVVDGIVDSLDEDADSPVPNITHRYPDRVLFLVSPVCASYCRFCTRRRKVGDPEKIPLNQFDAAFDYLRAHTEVRDVVLSGGDPFMLSDRRIDFFLSTLRAIPHIEILRIHSRVPNHLPERITAELCDVIRRHHPVYVNVHFNHPDELTAAAVAALGRLADAGIPLGSQTVLLRGVNDDPAIMKRLMQKLLMARVKPYYIYQADVVAGAEHFRTSVREGLEVIEAIRGWTSGLGVPHYVIDAPGGGGKIPLLPEYVQAITDTQVVLRNYAGETYRYPLPAESLVRVCDAPNRLALEPVPNARAKRKNGVAKNGVAKNGVAKNGVAKNG
ncbi:MAG: KamA family radical SAM protein, partial [Gemmatimonadota bacterium]